MAETDTLERTTTERVQVANLPPADGGRGFARLSLDLMKSLGINEGEVIEIIGKRTRPPGLCAPIRTTPG